MINKIKNFEYNTPDDLWLDCELIFSNCSEFNEDDSPIRIVSYYFSSFAVYALNLDFILLYFCNG